MNINALYENKYVLNLVSFYKKMASDVGYIITYSPVSEIKHQQELNMHVRLLRRVSLLYWYEA